MTLACAPIDDRHTAEHLESTIKNLLERFCRTGNVVAIVTDSAAANIAMKLPFQHFRCVAHLLQLSIRRALEHVETTLSKARDLVRSFEKLIYV